MKKFQLEIKWAAIFVAMMLAWMVLERLAGFHDERVNLHPIVTNFIAVPAIAVFVFALREKRRRAYGGAMTYGQGFLCGAIITLLVTLVTPLTQYLTSTVISPHYFANVIRYSVENGLMTQEAAESTFNLKTYLVQATIGAPVMGLLTTAIVAIFSRGKRAA